MIHELFYGMTSVDWLICVFGLMLVSLGVSLFIVGKEENEN